MRKAKDKSVKDTPTSPPKARVFIAMILDQLALTVRISSGSCKIGRDMKLSLILRREWKKLTISSLVSWGSITCTFPPS
jgi:hypothetical protein